VIPAHHVAVCEFTPREQDCDAGEVRAVNVATFRDDCDVAVIGAGPYGLALAAHLKAAKSATRVFGTPLSSWRNHMPKGMKLVSPWRETHIADPQKKFTLDVFARQHGFGPVADRIPLERFVSYGEWFQRQSAPDLDTRTVIRVEDTGSGFCLVLADGEPIRARRVVVAAGLARQEFRPVPFVGLPSELVSHTCEHARLDRWRGRRVAVIGRGQGACEAAALLRQAGTEVELICRGDIRWRDGGDSDAAALSERSARPRHRPAVSSAIGSLALSWLNARPDIMHRAPAGVRGWINARILRPAAAGWVKPLLDGMRVHAGRTILGAKIQGNQVGVALDNGLRVYDHVLLATGYRVDIGKLRMLPRELLQRVAQADGSPLLAAGFVSTVPGLYFVGASAARSFGPLMHAIAGAGYAARNVTKTLLAPHARQQRQSLVQMDCDFLTGVDGLRR
jgi:cation diffusion facilitator CzcD-associated flavoprotein CzcO